MENGTQGRNHWTSKLDRRPCRADISEKVHQIRRTEAKADTEQLVQVYVRTASVRTNRVGLEQQARRKELYPKVCTEWAIANAVAITTIRLRIDGRSTAYQMLLRT